MDKDTVLELLDPCRLPLACKLNVGAHLLLRKRCVVAEGKTTYCGTAGRVTVRETSRKRPSVNASWHRRLGAFDLSPARLSFLLFNVRQLRLSFPVACVSVRYLPPPLLLVSPIFSTCLRPTHSFHRCRFTYEGHLEASTSAGAASLKRSLTEVSNSEQTGDKASPLEAVEHRKMRRVGGDERAARAGGEASVGDA